MLLAPIFAVVALLPTQQPATGPSPAEIAAIKKLSFLVGKWEGEGWSQTGPRRDNFRGTETVQLKLSGKALLIEGLFRDTATNNVGHETLAVVTFDEKTGKYRFSTFLFNRPNAEFELTVRSNGFSWQMKPTESVVVEYTMILEDGVWHEVGEATIAGRPKMKVMEMKLKKVG
jgi:hypothetical protein